MKYQPQETQNCHYLIVRKGLPVTSLIYAKLSIVDLEGNASSSASGASGGGGLSRFSRASIHFFTVETGLSEFQKGTYRLLTVQTVPKNTLY